MNKNINPALKDLEGLIGEWQMIISNASFLPDLKAVVNSSATFEWFEDGKFFILRQGSKDTAPWAIWLIGHDQDSKDFTVLYIDDRKVSRVYKMSLENDIWQMWRNSAGFIQRFTAKISKDKQKIEGSWEKSTDGKTWTHDFDLTYIKTQK